MDALNDRIIKKPPQIQNGQMCQCQCQRNAVAPMTISQCGISREPWRRKGIPQVKLNVYFQFAYFKSFEKPHFYSNKTVKFLHIFFLFQKHGICYYLNK